MGREVAWVLVDHTMLHELRGVDSRMEKALVQLELAQELVGRIAFELVLEPETVDHWHTY
jgi:hypothetical protein